MHTHDPSFLDGPVSGNRSWWQGVRTAHGYPPDLHQPALGASLADALISCHSGAGEKSAPRAELIARVRQEIAMGVYETAKKWDIALRRLLERLARE
jgi:hypothetical protein